MTQRVGLKKILQEYNIKYTRLTFDKPFEYYMFDHIKRNGNKGYLWCGGRCRWGTTKKLQLLNKYCKGNKQLIGIAFDERDRIKGKPNKEYPLISFGMTESDCLDYCYSKGFFWEEDGIRLYDILDRVSCWCCKNKNMKELKMYYTFLPKYWNKLKEMQNKIPIPFKEKYSIYDLEERFKNEND